MHNRGVTPLMLLSAALFFCVTAQDVFVRYNYLGYSPTRKKRMIVMAEKDLKNQKWRIADSAGTAIQEGVFSKSVYGRGDHTPLPFNYVIDFSSLTAVGTYRFETKGCEPARLIIARDPYRGIISEPLHWMRAARCGSTETVDHGACHFGDTACTVHSRQGNQNYTWIPDSSRKKLNLVGGWHDAGDYLKFTLTISYAAYFLLRAYEVNPSIFEKNLSSSDLVDILDEARWGLEYLMRTMPNDSTFIIQVGGYDDHNVGLRMPEDDELDGKRGCYVALSPTQMGYTAAALALGSTIFDKVGRQADATRYAAMAKKVMRSAMKNQDVFPAWYTANFHFYNDNSVYDNLQLGAIEVYRLTREDEFLQAARTYAAKARNAGWRAWESVNMPAHLRLMEFEPVARNDLRVDLDEFTVNSKSAGNLWGLPLKYVWAGLYSYIGIGSAAMEYVKITGDNRYEPLALNMIDYLLGVNNWGISFVASQKIPTCIRHPFSQIYTLQGDKFPTGAISEGPGDKFSHDKNRRWFSFDVTAQPTHRFNTNKGVFYDHPKDFMCMETIISGVADGIYMLALASRMYNE